MRSPKRPRNNPTVRNEPQRQVTQHTITQEVWQGPLPPPHTLEKFRDLVPDAPERIFAQWEKEAQHRRDYERTALEGAITKDRIGQYGAISFALCALLVAGVCAWIGQTVIAGILGGGTIASVVGAFLYQRAIFETPKKK